MMEALNLIIGGIYGLGIGVMLTILVLGWKE